MIYSILETRLQAAVKEVLADADASEVKVRPCPDARFGDYQTASLMSLAKARRQNPRQLAAEVLKHLNLDDWCDPPEVAGAGFINLRIRANPLVEFLCREAESRSLFFRTAEAARTVVVDFSSPNVAKPMHVGHIRSTILGDCLARVNRALGHRVITDNHIGDWGTQFGKLLVGWKRHLDPIGLKERPLDEMERLYRQINAACEEDVEVLNLCRQELVKLQQGDPENRGIWTKMIEMSRRKFDEVYGRLGVLFDHTLGESFYNERLGGVVDSLRAKGLIRESEGALVAFFEEEPELKANPAIVRKSDGAANYTTTDLATLQYRWETWRPDDVYYVTDGRQQLHFRQLFTLFRRWYSDMPTRLHHVWFGSILGDDGKPFRTRSGDTVRLDDLLDEAEQRAYQVVTSKNAELDEASRRDIARIVGLGAVKYADLLPSRQSDYVFSWERMLALNGNTAPYLQYAYTRIRSIFRRAGDPGISSLVSGVGTATLATPEEADLAKHLVNFGLVLDGVSEEGRPNYLCNYLYELAGRFARFYERCPVLKADDAERSLRLLLCELTARMLRQGLDLLGIEVSERM